MTAVWLLSADLLLVSQFEGAARAAGLKPTARPRWDALVETAGVGLPEAIFMDLTAAGLDLASVVAAAGNWTPRPKLVAFGPHVDAERLNRARQAGCDQVLARGALHAHLRKLLAEVAAHASGESRAG